MNKRRSRRPALPTFHEALPVATPVVVGPDELLRQGAVEATRYAHVLASATMQLGRAAGLDVAHYGHRLGQLITSRTARRLYLVMMAIVGITTVTAGSFVAISTLNLYASDITSPAILIAKKNTGITLLDRNGTVLYRGYGAANRTTVTNDQLPPHMTDATLAAEDAHFYDHAGFSLPATARAVYVDITKGGRVEGGSTITQQLVKNALLTSNKTFERKFQEILLSMELERRYSKNQILNMYLNEVYYGEGSYGVGAAAQTYFHKPASQLTLGETAMLAGLPLGPSRLDPAMHPAEAVARRNYVLDRMATLGKITPAEATTAKAETLTAYPQVADINAPHFVFYVLDQLRATYGDDAVEQGGMTVITSLDLTKQNQAQSIVAQQVAKLAPHHVTNGALVSLDPSNGDVLAMVGSTDYNAPGFGSYNVALADLQPGSSFKPFAYVTAFAKGWNGATHVDDAPMSLPNGDGTMFVPQNYDLKFRGSVSLRRALANSLNIPALKVLQFAGIDDTINTAHALGITTLNSPSDHVISLVLGSGVVKPIDMAAAYAGFDTGGLKVTPRSILTIKDRVGKTIFTAPTPTQPRVLDSSLAYMITNILSDNQARTEEFGANSPLKLSRPAAAKTGTTNDFRDNWTVGYTPNLVTAVWVGNNDHTAMEGVDGITGAAPIWHDYMEAASSAMPVESFVAPPGIVTLRVCASDGGLAQPGTPSIDEVFPASALPNRHCATATPQPTPTPSPSPVTPPSEPNPTPAPTDTPAPTVTPDPKPGRPTPPPTFR